RAIRLARRVLARALDGTRSTERRRRAGLDRARRIARPSLAPRSTRRSVTHSSGRMEERNALLPKNRGISDPPSTISVSFEQLIYPPALAEAGVSIGPAFRAALRESRAFRVAICLQLFASAVVCGLA